MYYLRQYEFIALRRGHVWAAMYFNQGYGRKLVGPGFLNMVNRYYQEQLWR